MKGYAVEDARTIPVKSALFPVLLKNDLLDSISFILDLINIYNFISQPFS